MIPQRDAFGQMVQATPDGANPWLYWLLAPGGIKTARMNGLDAYLLDTYQQTADARVYPAPAVRGDTITYTQPVDKNAPPVAKKEGGPQVELKLNLQEIDTLNRYVGVARVHLLFRSGTREKLINMPYDERPEALSKIYSEGLKQAKGLFIAERYGQDPLGRRNAQAQAVQARAGAGEEGSLLRKLRETL